MQQYHKIDSLFERDLTTKKIIYGKFKNKTIEYLQNVEWEFTEKIDGTNIRVYWDGHKITFGGRTDKAQIPEQLLMELEKLFSGRENEEIFEQLFGENQIILFGEGYGEKIQKHGERYCKGNKFILFDVLINGNYLSRVDVEDIAIKLNINYVPIVIKGTIQDGINYVKEQPNSEIAENGIHKAEGIVGRPTVELRDRLGRRIIVKIKLEDLRNNYKEGNL